MTSVQRVTLVGLGAIGASYGERLFVAPGVDLRVLVDEARKRRYEKSGVRVNGRRIDFPLYVPAHAVEPADLVLFCVKYDDLAEAIEMVSDHVGPNTIFMSLLNGIASEEDIQAAFPENAVLHAISVAIDAVREGRDVKYSNLGYISFGDATGRHADAVRAVCDVFDRVGIAYETPDDILRAVWWKFMINVGVNQASAVLRAPYGVFQQSEDAREVMRMAMREVVAIAQKRGISLREEDVRRFDDILNAMSPSGKTSMLQDVEAGRPTEVEQFAGKVIDLGKQLGVPTPINRLLYHAIRAHTPHERLHALVPPAP